MEHRIKKLLGRVARHGANSSSDGSNRQQQTEVAASKMDFSAGHAGQARSKVGDPVDVGSNIGAVQSVKPVSAAENRLESKPSSPTRTTFTQEPATQPLSSLDSSFRLVSLEGNPNLAYPTRTQDKENVFDYDTMFNGPGQGPTPSSSVRRKPVNAKAEHRHYDEAAPKTAQSGPEPRKHEGTVEESNYHRGIGQFATNNNSKSMIGQAHDPARISNDCRVQRSMPKASATPDLQDVGRRDTDQGEVAPGVLSAEDDKAGYTRRPTENAGCISVNGTKSIDPSVSNDIDLSTTQDVDYRARYAPTVTHETVYPEIQNIREERITREIHNHDVYHRMLPVVDVQVLPPRHFVQDHQTGNMVEVSPSALPGRTGAGNQSWIIAETASSDQSVHRGPRQFSARAFDGDEGNYKEYVCEDGVKRTERTWIHPPVLEAGGLRTGQTQPLELVSQSTLNANHSRNSDKKPDRMPGEWVEGDLTD